MSFDIPPSGISCLCPAHIYSFTNHREDGKLSCYSPQLYREMTSPLYIYKTGVGAGILQHELQSFFNTNYKVIQPEWFIFMFVWPWIVTKLSSRSICSCSTAVYKPVWHIPLLSVQWINSWWWTDELSETCRVSWQNKFVKLIHLVGFIIQATRTYLSFMTK